MIRIIIIGITINTEKNVKNSFKEKIHKIYKILVFRNIIFFFIIKVDKLNTNMRTKINPNKLLDKKNLLKYF